MAQVESESPMRTVTRSAMNDAEARLLDAARSGDLAAFERLIHEHARAAGHLAARLLGNREDAEDAVQEAVFKAHRALAAFRGDCSFRTWLLRITFAVARDQLRKRQRMPRLAVAPADPATAILGGSDPGVAAGDRERLATLRAAIDELPQKQRAALLLKVYEEMPHDAIARVIGSTVGATRVYLVLARRSLRRRFAAWLERRDEDPQSDADPGELR
jgi:RNA polymerase sigma-70 factor (ECF subfamily)